MSLLTTLADPYYIFDTSDTNLIPGVQWLQGLVKAIDTIPVILQTIVATTGAVATGSTQMDVSGIPTNTTGDEFITSTIIPISAGSRLLVSVNLFVSLLSATPQHVSGALFRDSTVNAVASGAQASAGAQYLNNIKFSVVVPSNSVASTTFKVRAGSQLGATTLTFNGLNGVVVHGGKLASSIIIQELSE